MRQELLDLEIEAKESLIKWNHIIQLIQNIEGRISLYKDEYGILISETQALKKEMADVKTKVERSVRIIENLFSEKERWEKARFSFDGEMGILVGSTIIDSALITYGGYFDQNHREILIRKWSHKLINAGILHQTSLSMPIGLTTAEKRSVWESCSLPPDTLCLENAVMMEKCDRYPLIIDPSGQALQFISQYYKSQNIVITSFKDASMIKLLESSIRFGNPILIKDVENFDSIINSVLRKDFRKIGVRTLCSLGKKEVDVSPNFKLFLMTRNHMLTFSPDLSSRVSFVNFTVTHSILRAQCLDRLLKTERPDIDTRRKDLIKLQGEYQLRLYMLEKELLLALNRSKGNILDDDIILKTLETLKNEATEIIDKVDKTEEILEEVEQVTSQFRFLAKQCASIFFITERLASIKPYYQFSLEYFFTLLDTMLAKKYHLRTPVVLELEMFAIIYRSISKSLKQDDIVVFLMLMAQIKTLDDEISQSEMINLFNTPTLSLSQSNTDVAAVIGVESSHRVYQLESLQSFDGLGEKIVSDPYYWSLIMKSSDAVNMVVAFSRKFFQKKSEVSILFKAALIIKCLRLDVMLEMLKLLLLEIFGTAFFASHEVGTQNNLFYDGVSQLYMILSERGFETSFQVEKLAFESGAVKLVSAAMGSLEGKSLADTAIALAMHEGSWVLVKNAHLDLFWLAGLEKTLQSNCNKHFRLFVTADSNANIPISLLRFARIVTVEPPIGLKSSLLDSLSTIDNMLSAEGPAEKHRVLFMLVWLHSVIRTRITYVPIGFTKNYDFNDADLVLAANLMLKWLNIASQGRSNLSPEKIPWEALQELLSKTIYGGKVDNQEDQNILNVLVQDCFNVKVFDTDYEVVARFGDHEKVTIPDGSEFKTFADWMRNLDGLQSSSPHWVGLPADADTLVKIAAGNFFILIQEKERSGS